jgi:hypothetical protein
MIIDADEAGFTVITACSPGRTSGVEPAAVAACACTVQRASRATPPIAK